MRWRAIRGYLLCCVRTCDPRAMAKEFRISRIQARHRRARSISRGASQVDESGGSGTDDAGAASSDAGASDSGASDSGDSGGFSDMSGGDSGFDTGGFDSF